jgi:hypothetical protein
MRCNRNAGEVIDVEVQRVNAVLLDLDLVEKEKQ